MKTALVAVVGPEDRGLHRFCRTDFKHRSFSFCGGPHWRQPEDLVHLHEAFPLHFSEWNKVILPGCML